MNVTDRFRRQIEASSHQRQPNQSAKGPDKRKSQQTEYDQIKKELDPEKLETVKTIAKELKVPVIGLSNPRNTWFTLN